MISGTMTPEPTPEPEGMFVPSRPKAIPIIAAMLVVLAVLGLISFALSFGTFGFKAGGPGTFVVENSGGPTPKSGPGGGSGPVFQYGGGPGGGARTFGGGGPGSVQASGGPGPLRLFGILGPALPMIRGVWIVLVIGLTFLCAWFIWKRQKRWALNLGMVIALLVLLGTLPGFVMGGGVLRFAGWFGYLQTGLNVLKAAASLPIIVLGMLPSVRDYFS